MVRDNTGQEGLFSQQSDRVRDLGHRFRRLTKASSRPLRSFDTPAGFNFGLQSFGHGPPIVFLTNGLFSRVALGDLPRQLANVGRVTVIELQGLNPHTRLVEGLSDYRSETLADAFESAIKSVDATEELVIISQGVNVLLASEWARHHPERVRGLCFIDGLTAPVSLDRLSNIWAKLVEDVEPLGPFAVNYDAALLNGIYGVLAGGSGTEAADRLAAHAEHHRSDLQRLASIANMPVEHLFPVASTHAQTIDTWLRSASMPKLFIDSQPFVFGDTAAEREYPNQTVVRVNGPGLATIAAPGLTEQFIRLWLHQLSA
jgi:haloalkane dehalogenase